MPPRLVIVVVNVGSVASTSTPATPTPVLIVRLLKPAIGDGMSAMTFMSPASSWIVTLVLLPKCIGTNWSAGLRIVAVASMETTLEKAVVTLRN